MRAEQSRVREAKSKKTPTETAEVRNSFGLTQAEFTQLIGHSLRSVAAWEHGKTPYPAAQQRLKELRRLHAALKEIVKPRVIHEWLTKPNAIFGGLKPIEVIERGEIDRIWEMIFLMRSGTPG